MVQETRGKYWGGGWAEHSLPMDCFDQWSVTEREHLPHLQQALSTFSLLSTQLAQVSSAKETLSRNHRKCKENISLSADLNNLTGW